MFCVVSYRVNDGPCTGHLRHQAALHDVRRVHHTGKQHHRVGGVRVLAIRRARFVRGRVQRAELHERQLVTGARVQGSGPQAGTVRQRFPDAARPHAQLYQKPLTDGRGCPVVLPAAHHRSHKRQVSVDCTRTDVIYYTLFAERTWSFRAHYRCQLCEPTGVLR